VDRKSVDRAGSAVVDWRFMLTCVPVACLENATSCTFERASSYLSRPKTGRGNGAES